MQNYQKPYSRSLSIGWSCKGEIHVTALGAPPLMMGENRLTVTLGKRDTARVKAIQVGEFELSLPGS